MPIDPENPVVLLCVEGMNCERERKFERALEVFMQAWERSTNDFERCIAAHYVARHQATPAEALDWNLLALSLADKVNDESTDGFYPSLYLNVGKAHEDLGDRAEARKYYGWAAETMHRIPEGIYKATVRDGIERGLGRVAD